MKAIVATDDLRRLIKKLKPFTCDYKLKWQDKMKYIYISVDNVDEKLRGEAMSGDRFAVEYINCLADENFTAYINPFQLLKTDEEKSEIEIIGNVCTVTMGEYSIRTIQPEGEWYDTKELIKNAQSMDGKYRIGVNPNYLIDALKTMKTDKFETSIVVIEFTDNNTNPIIIKQLKDDISFMMVAAKNLH